MYPQNDWRSYLEHSAKGERWKEHKYLYITPDGRYVYPEDVDAKKYSRLHLNRTRRITGKGTVKRGIRKLGLGKPVGSYRSDMNYLAAKNEKALKDASKEVLSRALKTTVKDYLKGHGWEVD